MPAVALTELQQEIIALVAEGLPNQAIADRLGLTRIAVSEHIAAILWQMGLPSRSAIAVWTIEQDWYVFGR